MEILYLRFFPSLAETFYGGSLEGDLFVDSCQNTKLEELSINNAPFWLQQKENTFVNQNGNSLVL